MIKYIKLKSSNCLLLGTEIPNRACEIRGIELRKGFLKAIIRNPRNSPATTPPNIYPLFFIKERTYQILHAAIYVYQIR